MTSLLGFEALMHGKTVVCAGRPFYAGWGLTQDLAPPSKMRQPVSLDALVHATLIDYPMYYDPVSGLAATPEAVAERLAGGFAEAPPVLIMSRMRFS